MSIGNRLKIIRKDLSETQKGMARLIGASYRTYQEWEAHNNVPNGKYLHVISQMGYDINWLLTGSGEMKIERVIGVRHDLNILSKEEVIPFIINTNTNKDIQLFKIATTSLEPEINLGDVVFYDTCNHNITDGALYTIETPSGKMVKRLLYKGSGGVEATCNYSSFILDENCKILGRIIYCLQAK